MSEYIRKLVEEAEAGLVDWDAGLEHLVADTKNAVEADSFDQLAWDMLREQVPGLDEQTGRMVEAMGESLAQAMEDLFNLLHQGDPRFTERAEMDPEFELNLVVLFDLSQTEEFKALYDETRYDEFQTAFAMLTMEEFVRAAFEAVSEQREQMQQAAQEQSEALQQLADAVDEAMSGDVDGQALQDATAAAEAAKQKVENARSAGQDAAQDAVEKLRQGAMQAKEDIDAQREALEGYGYGSEPGELQRMSFEERRALAKRIDQSRLKEFAKLLGQFRISADAMRRRKVKHAPEEVFDVELSNDLTRLTVPEMTALATPELEDMFWLRYAQHGLLTKKLRGSERSGQGPIIVVCDESYSMNQELAQGYSREAWSKAVTLALADQAKRGKRDFTYIGFASEGSDYQIDFPGGVTPIEKVIEFTEHFLAGGTHYERPLRRAMNIVQGYDGKGSNKPDIVFITDDECEVDPDFVTQWRKVKDQADVAVYGIQLGRSGAYATMQSLADTVLSIDSLTATPQGVQQLFREI